MTTYNTQNPLGSTDPRDLYDNAENLDVAANSSADTFQDRLGKSRLTWAGIVKAGSGDPGIAVDAAARAEAAASSVEQDAEQIAQDAAQQAVQDVVDGVDGQVERAEGYADLAESARDAAFVNADVYPDIATGLAAVGDGEQFQIVQGDLIARFRRVNASTEELVATYPANKIVGDVILKIGGFEATTESVAGAVAPSGSPSLPSNYTYGPAAQQSRTLVSEVSVRTLAGSGYLFAYEPFDGSYKLTAKVSVACVAGVNRFTYPFGMNKVFPPGTYIQYGVNTGASLAYETGGNGGFHISGSGTLRNVGDISDINSYANTPAIQVRQISIDKALDEYISENADGLIANSDRLDFLEYSSITESSSSGKAEGTVAYFSSYTRVFGYQALTAGLIYNLKIRLDAAGSGEIHIYRSTGAGLKFEVDKVIPVTVGSAGINDIALSEPVRVNEGDFVGYAPISGGSMAYYTADTSFPVGYFFDPRPGTIGQSASPNGQTRVAIYFDVIKVRAVENELEVSQIDSRVSTLEEGRTTEIKSAKSLVFTRFPGATLPASWTEAGGWTVSDGLTSPATGGWGVYALSGGDSSTAKRRISARFYVGEAGSIFGICAEPPESSGGAVALVDGVAETLSVYAWTGTSNGTNPDSVPIPFSLVVGRYYLLEVVKDWLSSAITLTDTTTLQSVTLKSADRAAGYKQWHGRSGVMFLSGAIRVDWFDVAALYPQKLRAIIIGDSNSEGNYLGAGAKTWAELLEDQRGVEGDIMSAPRAGDETINFEARKAHDLLAWSPDYVLLALGTNDTSQSTWRTNMAETISQIESIGAEPILCTQVPRTASQTLRNAMNQDIRDGYFGRFRYVDLALSVSLNNDGETWDPAYDWGDGTHANAAGQQRMYQQALADAPFIVS